MGAFFLEPLSVNYYAPMARRPEGRLPYRQLKGTPSGAVIFLSSLLSVNYYAPMAIYILILSLWRFLMSDSRK